MKDYLLQKRRAIATPQELADPINPFAVPAPPPTRLPLAHTIDDMDQDLEPIFDDVVIEEVQKVTTISPYFLATGHGGEDRYEPVPKRPPPASVTDVSSLNEHGQAGQGQGEGDDEEEEKERQQRRRRRKRQETAAGVEEEDDNDENDDDIFDPAHASRPTSGNRRSNGGHQGARVVMGTMRGGNSNNGGGPTTPFLRQQANNNNSNSNSRSATRTKVSRPKKLDFNAADEDAVFAMPPPIAGVPYPPPPPPTRRTSKRKRSLPQGRIQRGADDDGDGSGVDEVEDDEEERQIAIALERSMQTNMQPMTSYFQPTPKPAAAAASTGELVSRGNGVVFQEAGPPPPLPNRTLTSRRTNGHDGGSSSNGAKNATDRPIIALADKERVKPRRIVLHEHQVIPYEIVVNAETRGLARYYMYNNGKHVMLVHYAQLPLHWQMQFEEDHLAFLEANDDENVARYLDDPDGQRQRLKSPPPSAQQQTKGRKGAAVGHGGHDPSIGDTRLDARPTKARASLPPKSVEDDVNAQPIDDQTMAPMAIDCIERITDEPSEQHTKKAPTRQSSTDQAKISNEKDVVTMRVECPVCQKQITTFEADAHVTACLARSEVDTAAKAPPPPNDKPAYQSSAPRIFSDSSADEADIGTPNPKKGRAVDLPERSIPHHHHQQQHQQPQLQLQEERARSKPTRPILMPQPAPLDGVSTSEGRPSAKNKAERIRGQSFALEDDIIVSQEASALDPYQPDALQQQHLAKRKMLGRSEDVTLPEDDDDDDDNEEKEKEKKKEKEDEDGIVSGTVSFGLTRRRSAADSAKRPEQICDPTQSGRPTPSHPTTSAAAAASAAAGTSSSSFTMAGDIGSFPSAPPHLPSSDAKKPQTMVDLVSEEEEEEPPGGSYDRAHRRMAVDVAEPIQSSNRAGGPEAPRRRLRRHDDIDEYDTQIPQTMWGQPAPPTLPPPSSQTILEQSQQLSQSVYQGQDLMALYRQQQVGVPASATTNRYNSPAHAPAYPHPHPPGDGMNDAQRQERLERFRLMMQGDPEENAHLGYDKRTTSAQPARPFSRGGGGGGGGGGGRGRRRFFAKRGR